MRRMIATEVHRWLISDGNGSRRSRSSRKADGGTLEKTPQSSNAPTPRFGLKTAQTFNAAANSAARVDPQRKWCRQQLTPPNHKRTSPDTRHQSSGISNPTAREASKEQRKPRFIRALMLFSFAYVSSSRIFQEKGKHHGLRRRRLLR